MQILLTSQRVFLLLLSLLNNQLIRLHLSIHNILQDLPRSLILRKLTLRTRLFSDLILWRLSIPLRILNRKRTIKE